MDKLRTWIPPVRPVFRRCRKTRGRRPCTRPEPGAPIPGSTNGHLCSRVRTFVSRNAAPNQQYVLASERGFTPLIHRLDKLDDDTVPWLLVIALSLDRHPRLECITDNCWAMAPTG